MTTPSPLRPPWWDDKPRMREIITEYERRITWNTTCKRCADRLDSLIAEREAGYREGYAAAQAEATGAKGPDDAFS